MAKYYQSIIGRMKRMRYTLKDLQHDFPDDDACLEWLKDALCPDGIVCPHEQRVTPHHKIRKRKSYSCAFCGRHFHPTASTIFHKSSTPLTSWFYVIYLIANTRAGISAKQIERELGVTYKTAWRMLNQIRKLMGDDSDRLAGEVEVDEMYLGGNPQRRSTARRHNHQVVFGMVERGGRAKVRHVRSSGVRVLLPEIDNNVEPTAVIYSDDYGSYKTLSRRGYVHHTVNHSKRQYVSGRTHTQNVENLWSHMKRGIKGVYRSVSPKHLQSYVNEYAYRYSHRNDFQPIFWSLMGRIEKAQSSGSPSSE